MTSKMVVSVLDALCFLYREQKEAETDRTQLICFIRSVQVRVI